MHRVAAVARAHTKFIQGHVDMADQGDRLVTLPWDSRERDEVRDQMVGTYNTIEQNSAASVRRAQVMMDSLNKSARPPLRMLNYLH